MLLTPLPADQLLSYTGKRYALATGVLVPSNGALTLILMQVLGGAALLSLETTGLRAPSTVLFKCRELGMAVSYVSLELAAVI